jgi:hypothetical protein
MAVELSPDAQRALAARLSNGDNSDHGNAGSRRPIHVLVMRFCGFTLGYMFLGLGWVIEHIGRGIYLFGREMKDAARSID